uniref:GOLD domain-containing protein n=1 Tax=Enterobius vermicularis TaxID=51028 RepID=A0A0N4V8Q3_ENTVE
LFFQIFLPFFFSGTFEVCVTAKIGLGTLKTLLEIFTYNPNAIKQSFDQAAESHEIKKSLQRLFSIFYSLRLYHTQVGLDTHLQEKNMQYIDAFSTIQTAIMILSGVIQVYVIQRFFYIDPRRIRI